MLKLFNIVIFMKRVKIALILGLVFVGASFAQSRQSLFLEAAGQGLSFTVNYDTRLLDEVDGIGLRVGASYMKTSKIDFLRVPVSFNYLIGSDGKFLELGLGATFGNSKMMDTDSKTLGTLCIGYRVQPPEGGLCYRAALTPYFNVGPNSVFIPYFGGVSIGYCF